jgi:hypothetical protein
MLGVGDSNPGGVGERKQKVDALSAYQSLGIWRSGYLSCGMSRLDCYSIIELGATINDVDKSYCRQRRPGKHC